MKIVLLVALCLLGVALAAPPPTSYTSDSKDAEILRYDNDNTGFGPFRFGFEQSDGTKHEQEGQVINEGLENPYLTVKGRFSYVVNGVTYIVTYVADENGYQPEIEQGPGGAVPDAVVASLLG